MANKTDNSLQVVGLSKSFGDKKVLKDLSFTIPQNDFAVICGKPGNGKSVLVRSIMGLETIDVGQILARNQDVTDEDPGSRNIGYIPQSFALFPHFSVRENIEYPLDLIKATKQVKDESVVRVSELLKITDLLDKKPNQLSGGQKQRVAIARGLAKETDVYLLDDPLVGLDFKLRERLIDDLRLTQEKLGVTFLYVTSDPLETLQLAKTVLILAEGRIAQQGPLIDVYDKPLHLASLTTLGFPEANVISGSLQDSTFESTILKIKTSLKNGSGAAVAGIRPEAVMLGKQSGAITLTASVTLLENLGSEIVAYLDVSGTQIITVVSHRDAGALNALGTKSATISIKPESIVLFDSQSQAMIGIGAALV
jgi:ABC-type sugar transport system ATPase subunit